MAERANAASFEYLDTVTEVEKFTSEIARAREIALDTEGASFHRFVDRIYLLQLSTRDRHAVIDPLPIGVPAGLGAPARGSDASKWSSTTPTTTCDCCTRTTAGTSATSSTRASPRSCSGYTAFGLAALLERYLRREARQEAPARRLVDAAAHAGHARLRGAGHRFLLELRDRMAAELERVGRTGMGAEEFALLEGTRWDRGGAGVVVPARERRARSHAAESSRCCASSSRGATRSPRTLDRATFRVVGNEQLLEIARSQPQSRDALGEDQGNAARHPGAARRRAARRGARGTRRPRGRAAEASRAPRDGIAIPTSRRVSAPSRPCATRPRSGSSSTRASSARAIAWRRSRAGTRRPSTSSRRSRSSAAGRWRSSAPTSCARWSRTARRRRPKYRVRSSLCPPRSRGAFREPADWVSVPGTSVVLGTAVPSVTTPCTPSPSARCDPATRRASTPD